MSVSVVILCLTVFLTCVIVDTFVEGNSCRRYHGHHLRPQNGDFQNPLLLNLLLKHSKNSESHSRCYGIHQQRRRHLEAQANLFPSLDYENAEEVQTPVIPRNPRLEFLRIREVETRSKHENSAKRMHHIRHSSYLKAQADSLPSLEHEDEQKTVNHQRREAVLDDYGKSLLQRHDKDINGGYEREVKAAQNSSICKYTIESDIVSDRVPKVLEHVKCNHIGSSCLGTNTHHCCIQTYKNIKVSYSNGRSGTMKLYVGCICAYHILQKQKASPNIDN